MWFFKVKSSLCAAERISFLLVLQKQSKICWWKMSRKHRGMNSCHGRERTMPAAHGAEKTVVSPFKWWVGGTGRKMSMWVSGIIPPTPSASWLKLPGLRGLTEVWSYHGLPDVGQSALGFVFCKLQAADVLQTSSVLAHLLVDDQLHTPTGKRLE